MRVPSKTEHTNMRLNYGSGLDTPPASTQGVLSSKHQLGSLLADRKGHHIEKGFWETENEGRKLPPPPPCPRPHPAHHPPWTLTQKGFPPPTPCGYPGGAPEPPPLLLHMLPFVVSTVGLPPR
jgi:hypothetical protein